MEQTWAELLVDLHHTINVKGATKAARQIAKRATTVHVKELYQLLNGDSFFVREAAAIPLARLEGANVLPALFKAMQRGEQEGHDNDGLTNTIIDVLESHKAECLPMLQKMLESTDAETRTDAAWALGYIAKAVDPKVLFDVFNHDPAPGVQTAAANSLQTYLFIKKKQPIDLQALIPFHGKWLWKECEPHLSYGFEITGTTGICIKTNAPTFSIGDKILRIAMQSGQSFVGEQIFTNAVWYPVTARLENQYLYMQGAGIHWKLERIV
jgi:hypothetical protein